MSNRYKSTAACLMALLIGLMAPSCSRDEATNSESVIEIPKERQDPSVLDRWIDTNFLPYGIEVLYRWDKHSVAYGTYAYPPTTERVLPVLQLVKSLCLDLYDHKDKEGRDFLLAKVPLRIYLFGGKGLDSRGFELISSPRSSALELYIYNVNNFDPKSEDDLYALLHSVHHQLIRRFMELFPYDRDAFRRLSDYTEVGIDLALEGQRRATTARQRFGVSAFANSDGFLTIYGMLDSEADFADIITANLCNHPEEIRSAISRAAVPLLTDEDPEVNKRYEERAKRAAEALKTKQAFVENYYYQVVGKRLSEMQIRSLGLINNYKQTYHVGQ